MSPVGTFETCRNSRCRSALRCRTDVARTSPSRRDGSDLAVRRRLFPSSHPISKLKAHDAAGRVSGAEARGDRLKRRQFITLLGGIRSGAAADSAVNVGNRPVEALPREPMKVVHALHDSYHNRHVVASRKLLK